MQRVWLDPTAPCLPAAAEWLLKQATPAPGLPGRVCDLRGLTCVLPGARAGRLLRDELLRAGEAAGRACLPPTILTPGRLIDETFHADSVRPTASPEEVALAWMQALERIDAATLAPLFGRTTDQPTNADALADAGGAAASDAATILADAPEARRDLAGTLAALHDELAGAELSFALVARRLEAMALIAEADRWRAMAAACETYCTVLREANLLDPHDARAAALRRGPADESRRLVLIGVVELNAMQRRAAAAFGERAAALVHADPADADRFDEFGCVIARQWIDEPIEIAPEQLRVADRPADQAQEALRAIMDLDGAHAADEITIGLGDASLSDVFQAAGRWAELHLHDAAGRPLSRSRPLRLLSRLTDWLEDRRFATFATLLRHPDVERWVTRHIERTVNDPDVAVRDWLTLLDRYFADHLHERLSGAWLGNAMQRKRMKAVWDAVHELCGAFDGPPRPLGAWMDAVLGVQQRVYLDDPPAAREAQRLGEALEALRDGLLALRRADSALQPQVDGRAAVRLALEHLAGRRIAAPVRTGQIEMLGYLELHLDTAPVLIVAGFNDGGIPQARHADAFLPDGLRQRLGLAHNAQRHGRDAYLLRTILMSRPRVTLIAGRRGRDNEPLTPSRLAMACDDETVLQRVRRLCRPPDGDADGAQRLPVGMPRCADSSAFIVPGLPQPLQLPETMSVTEFRLYLACPYRYALQRLLQLKSYPVRPCEMPPDLFGSVAHEVLERFGRDAAIRDADQPEDIAAFLEAAVEDAAGRRFGEDRSPAVQVQLEALRQRLRSFADCQADLRNGGWRIRHVEVAFDDGLALDVPGGEPMPVRGTIDRIDHHPGEDRWRIIDYKTSDSGATPHEVHHGRSSIPPIDDLSWKDLQLPLYDHLVRRADLNDAVNGEIELGYLVLPRQTDGAQFRAAGWTPDYLEHAIEEAQRIVCDIRAGRFDMNDDYGRFDPYARICHTTVFTATGDEDGDADALGAPVFNGEGSGA